MKRALAWILFLLILATWVPSWAQFTNEPAGSTRVLTCTWASDRCAGQYSRGTFLNVYTTNIISDGSALGSPPTVADAALINPIKSAPLGQGTTGGTDLGWWDDRVDREVYVGLWAKISLNGQNSAGTTKFVFLRATNNLLGTFRTNGFWGFQGTGSGSRNIIFGHNTSGIDNSHTCAADSGLICYPNIGSGTVPQNQWFRFEACIRASTTNTSRDGVVRWWINGVLDGDYRNMNYGTGNVNEWWWSQTWDGHGNSLGYDGTSHQYIDHTIVSIPPNGGCGGVPVGNPTNPPGAPAAPVLESVTPQ